MPVKSPVPKTAFDFLHIRARVLVGRRKFCQFCQCSPGASFLTACLLECGIQNSCGLSMLFSFSLVLRCQLMECWYSCLIVAPYGEGEKVDIR